MIPSQPEVPPDERIQDSRDPGLIALYHSYSRNGDKALPENCELDWEWAAGYADRFGCTFVDFESEDKTRYPKRSAYYQDKLFKHLIKHR